MIAVAPRPKGWAGVSLSARGIFITFEGTEGCGKSTQSKLLYRYLKNRGLPVVYLREPGGVKTSEKIRKILLNPGNRISPVCEMLLYMAARAEVVNAVIKPALLKGKIVVCDRFLDSTLVYQGLGLGLDLATIKSVGRLATQGINPDLTILLDRPIKRGLKCRQGKMDRIEKRNLAYHQKVRNGYLKLAGKEPARIKTVKVEEERFKTQQKIRISVNKFLNLRDVI
jgi:dTMP kinase